MNLIPKKIWQTYKDPYDSLPEYIAIHSRTWKEQNPEYEYCYMSDEEAAKFILEKYGQEYHDIFIRLPLGVMRGDMWRYLIVYEYGGIYADLDTTCLTPIDNWMKENAGMIICPEHDTDFCQWIFAAKPKHPAIKKVIDLMMERLKEKNFNIPHSVHYHTGPAVWTDGIFQYLDESRDSILNHAQMYNEKADQNGLDIFIYNGHENEYFGWRIFHWHAAKHIYGSQNWNENYVKWINQTGPYREINETLSE